MTINKRRVVGAVAAVGVLLLLAACAAGANDMAGTAAANGEVAGFWLGLWHGFIAPFTFIASLFTESVSMYEVHNNGGWYDFGFLLGVTTILGGGAGSGWRSRRRR